jgi:hypothetical protein
MATSPGDLENTDIENAKAFFNEYPIVDKKLDEPGLVDLWKRIEGLHNLISIWESNQAAISRTDPAELQRWRWQIRKRVWSHLIHAKYEGDDEQVKALVAIIRLHALFADRYIGDEIKYSTYVDVAEYAEVNGRYLAEYVEKKYGKDANLQEMNNK